MNKAKIDRTTAGLTTIATKVLEATPISEAWPITQIIGEMKRRGFTHDKKTIEGCLNSLSGKKLVAEPTRGHFKRVTANEKTSNRTLSVVRDRAEGAQPMEQQKPATPDAAKTDTPMERMMALADKVAAMAQEVTAEMESIAVEIQGEIDSAERKTKHLSQLQALLKDIAE